VKTPNRTRKPQEKAADSRADEKSTTRSQVKAATKKDLPKTVDDVLPDIAVKTDLLKGMSRSEVFAKIIVISKDPSLKERERQILGERLKEMGSR
jgi:hypothetical protein